MSTYVAKQVLDYEANFVVEANDTFEANANSEALASGTYAVYNKATEDYEPFSHITDSDLEVDDHEEN